MVKVIDYKERITEGGRSFFTLTLQGGVEIVHSGAGNQYVTIRKASLPTTFDESICQSLVGVELPGCIQRVECDPYEYTVPSTGEIILLNHRYEYTQEEMQPAQVDFTKHYTPSSNGVHKAVM
jgi:hypothetical protein